MSLLDMHFISIQFLFIFELSRLYFVTVYVSNQNIEMFQKC